MQHLLSEVNFIALTTFRAPLSLVRETLQNLAKTKLPPTRYMVEEGALDVWMGIDRDPPYGGSHPSRAVFYEPKSTPNTSAMISNLRDGWHTLVRVLVAHIPGEHVSIRSSLESESYPIQEMCLWEAGSNTRLLRVAKDDPTWQFVNEGAPRSFERTDFYKQKRIRDRLSRELLVDYLASMGWPIDEQSFWTADGLATILRQREIPDRG